VWHEPTGADPPDLSSKLDQKGRAEARGPRYVRLVSLSASDAPSYGALDEVLRRAGAVFAGHNGRSLAVNYGSAAGELAVCVRAVGLVDRSELTKLVLEAPSAQLGHLLVRLTGRTVAVGGALQTDDGWWCRAAEDRVILLSEPAAGERLREHLRHQAQVLHHVSVTIADRSDEWAAIALIGDATPKLLRALGAYGDSGDARSVSPFGAGVVHGVEVMWLLESDRRAVALVGRGQAAELWRALEDAGRPFGLSCVGHEAARRYALLERSADVSR
jgi:glycine cleavage system aminomethyltransferase T